MILGANVMGTGQFHAVYISCNYFLCVFPWVLMKYFSKLSTYLIYFKVKEENAFVVTHEPERKGEQRILHLMVWHVEVTPGLHRGRPNP